MDSMKVLFLDVDGVLNDLEWIKTNSPEPSVYASIDELARHIDPARVQMVNDVVEATGAEIVLSSSTRTDPRMSVVLARAGLVSEIYSTTPIPLWKTNVGGSEYIPITRAEEVLTWLSQNKNLIQSFAILDDQNHNWTDFHFNERPLSNSWVQTSFDNGGLTETKKQEVIEMLNR